MKRLILACCMLLPALALAQAQSYLRNNSFTNWESPHVHPLDITPDGTRLLAVNTANNALEIFDVSNTSILPVLLKSVPVGLDPVSVRARTNTEAWVVNVISDSVSIVNLSTGLVTQTLQTDDEPADVIFAGANFGEAFVSCAQAKTLLEFSATAPGTVLSRIPINGEQPRALATSSTGRYVYLAIFESGNGTTLLVGGQDNGFEHDNISDPTGPYGGVNPPPNNGKAFNPPINPALPAPPPVSLIVRRTASNGTVKWMDDNNTDWSAFVTGAKARTGTAGDRVAGWDLPDRDVAIIDTSNNNAVTYQSGLMNIIMSLAVNPASGAVTVVGTDATNQVRFEPVLQSTFVHVEGASFTPGGANSVFDLNPQINYGVKSVPVAQRQQAIGDPRGIAWNAAGTTAYVTGMGSNNVVLMSPTGARTGLITVGQGPTGIVLQAAGNRAFVLNKFDATLSTVNLATNAEAGRTSLLFDPTPAAIKLGRPMMYNTQINSGLGQVSCASCHVDSRWDRLAWDLGNPAGSMVTNTQNIAFHPMKGPMLTQTLVDTMQAPYLHWRGDRPALEQFEGAFQTLMGANAPATESQIQALRAFLATITIPPNPFRNLDNSYSTDVQMPGPNNTVFTVGDANQGAAEFEANCRSCHPGNTNRGFKFITTNLPFGAGARNPPTWKNFYKRIGLWFSNATASNSGFGFQQDGSFDSSQNESRDANMYAFMMSFNGGYPYEPAQLDASNWSNCAHAAVGKQVTLSPSEPTDTTGLLSQLETLAGQGVIGLVVKGAVPGAPVRGWMYLGNGLWQSDKLAEIDSTAALNAKVTAGAVLTFTAVPTESAVRIGIDMDSDGLLDGDDPSPAVPNVSPINLALNGTATAVSLYDPVNHSADKAIDGNTLGYYDQNSMVHTAGGNNDWWQVDLGVQAQISLIQLFNRIDACCTTRLSNVSVFVSPNPFTSGDLTATRAQAGVQEYFLSGYAGLLPQIPMQAVGRYVRVQLNATAVPLQLAEVRVMGYPVTDLAKGRPATSSSQWSAAYPPTLATDGNTDGSFFDGSLFISGITPIAQEWWQVDLGSVTPIGSITVWNRTDCCGTRLAPSEVFVSSSDMSGRSYAALLADTTVTRLPITTATGASLSFTLPAGSTGRFVKVQLAGTNSLALAEVQVFGPVANPVPLKTVVNLDSLFNVDAIALPDGPVRNGGIDADSYAYDSTVLGTSLTYQNLVFPLGPANVLSGVNAITVPVTPGTYKSLYLLATGVNGVQGNQNVVVTYTDGSTSTYLQSFSDWAHPLGNPGETTVAAATSRLNPSGALDTLPVNVYGYTFALAAGKSIQSVTLPPNNNVVVLGMGLSQ